ncbi:hypothetical protein O6H91_19G017700 [Diphasiastrum complanatum]|uniref:Uncharacterized protein n=1 Tax=Diphasiastrum complanatum TaxID=34168 RepID=A0ACC2AT94_DIPCM|nr:hypothetical protein O6H91_19G017700 [Diphasiastrum complanatum]
MEDLLRKSMDDERYPSEDQSRAASAEDKVSSVSFESADGEILDERSALGARTGDDEHSVPVQTGENDGSVCKWADDSSGGFVGAAANENCAQAAEEEAGLLKSMEQTISHSVQAIKEAVTETFTADSQRIATTDLDEVAKEAMMVHSAAHD